MKNTTKETKTENVFIRLTPAQREKLELYKEAKGLNVSQLFRNFLNTLQN